MTPGPVDLKVVRDRLQIVATCVTGLRALPAKSLDAFRSDPRNAPAADSLLRRAIEALFDTARHLLAKGHGHGALEYREVARLSHEKGLITDAEQAERFRQMAGYRNRLTHFYDEVTPEELHGILQDRLGDLEALCEALRQAATDLAPESD